MEQSTLMLGSATKVHAQVLQKKSYNAEPGTRRMPHRDSHALLLHVLAATLTLF